jgi:hypothetical protein
MKPLAHWPKLAAFALATVAAGIQSHGAEVASDPSVSVIRGSHSTATQDETVVVMRPERGSFLRETTRLAQEAQAREERAAAEQARETNRRLSGMTEAIEQAAEAIRDYPPRQHFVIVELKNRNPAKMPSQ